jgi:hypothetical protein
MRLLYIGLVPSLSLPLKLTIVQAIPATNDQAATSLRIGRIAMDATTSVATTENIV